MTLEWPEGAQHRGALRQASSGYGCSQESGPARAVRRGRGAGYSIQGYLCSECYVVFSNVYSRYAEERVQEQSSKDK